MTDTLDQIITKALCESFQVVTELKWEPESVAIYTAAVRDALLAEGEVLYRTPEHLASYFLKRPGILATERVLAIPLLVGVGCGNAKKDTP